MKVALADAVNLGWRLAATAHGHASDGALGSYHQERNEAGACVLHTIRALPGPPGSAPRRFQWKRLMRLLGGSRRLAAADASDGRLGGVLCGEAGIPRSRGRYMKPERPDT